MKVVIIGGVAGGASAAARLRRLDEQAQIVLFERGEYISFANCGLPYFVGKVIRDKERLVVQTPDGMRARFNVDIRIRSEVTRIDPEKKTVEVVEQPSGRTYYETYDKLILSPGAAPIRPPIEGLDATNVFTLRNIPDTYAMKHYVDTRSPKRAVVVGGGFIGIELAENLAERDVKVTVVELANQVIGPLDFEMAAIVHQHLKDKGIELYLETGLSAVTHQERYSTVLLTDGEEIKTDMIVLGIGVIPENALAKTAGLELGARGGIKVDKTMKTSDPNIYAVGDAIEVLDFVNGAPALIPLAGPANKQGRIAANNICGRYEEYPGTQGTSVLKAFDLTVAATGNNEKVLKRLNIPYEKSFTHALSHAGYYRDATPISLKLIFSPQDGRILGAQAVGLQGTEKRIDVIATAIRAGMTVHDLEKLELSYAPPYSSAKDPVNMAGYVSANIVKGDCQILHWHDIAGLDMTASVLIDVRTPYEFRMETVPGAINIPVDELRGSLATLPRDKELILFCQVGLRGYLAYRILVQHGFTKIKNLSGGYTTYAAAMREQSNRNIYRYDELPAQEPPSAGQPAEGKKKIALKIDASGLQCPGPIMRVSQTMNQLQTGDLLEITATDPAFAADIKAWCHSTGHQLDSLTHSGRQFVVRIVKGSAVTAEANTAGIAAHDKTIVVFSGDLDKAIASFIIANGAAAMGRKVTMFFTFWGLNILRKSQAVEVQKDFLSKMFGLMMPRGTEKLGLSKMNMLGIGGKLIRYIMGKKNVAPLAELIQQARQAGVTLIACSMSMDVMGIKQEELLDGIDIGGVAAYLTAAETADTNLFI